MDRNYSRENLTKQIEQSLSARRAWIEIEVVKEIANRLNTVALRKESVDRNIAEMRGISTKDASLSARRAWIEILYVC